MMACDFFTFTYYSISHKTCTLSLTPSLFVSYKKKKKKKKNQSSSSMIFPPPTLKFTSISILHVLHTSVEFSNQLLHEMLPSITKKSDIQDI
jgi:hypothetical protein